NEVGAAAAKHREEGEDEGFHTAPSGGPVGGDEQRRGPRRHAVRLEHPRRGEGVRGAVDAGGWHQGAGPSRCRERERQQPANVDREFPHDPPPRSARSRTRVTRLSGSIPIDSTVSWYALFTLCGRKLSC